MIAVGVRKAELANESLTGYESADSSCRHVPVVGSPAINKFSRCSTCTLYTPACSRAVAAEH